VSDSLIIRDLLLPARVGAFAEERSQPQDILISIEIRTDMTKAARSDELGNAVDYASILNEVESAVSEGPAALLEALADRIAGVVSAFDGVTGVTVEIEKAVVPVPQKIGRVAVRIER
jgi:FolB domain-containing protein